MGPSPSRRAEVPLLAALLLLAALVVSPSAANVSAADGDGGAAAAADQTFKWALAYKQTSASSVDKVAMGGNVIACRRPSAHAQSQL